MPYRTFSIACFALLFTVTPVPAQSALDRELTQLREQQAKALAVAVEPVNRRYQSALVSLLHRATQAKDLPTVSKISDELTKLGVPHPDAAEIGGPTIAGITKRLIGTKWQWFGKETITFLADGKAQWKENANFWPWRVTSAAHRTIEGENKQRGFKFTITLDRDLKTGTVDGEGGTRTIRLISP